MKIKGTSKALKPKYFYITFAASLVVCLALRFYHVIKLIDVETGFYSQSNFTVTVFYVILAAAGLFMLIGSFVSANNGKFEIERMIKKNKLLGGVSLVLSLAFITEFAQSFINALYAQQNSTIYTDISFFAQFMKSGYLPGVFTALFALITSIYFIKFAVSCFGDKCKIASKKVFALMPVIWGLIKLVSFFVKQISFVRISDLFLEIAAVSFTLIFLFSFAQCVSGVYADVAEWRITGVGLTAALLLLVLNIPKLCLTIFGGGNHIVVDYPVNYAEILLGLFILTVILSFNRKQTEPEISEENEE